MHSLFRRILPVRRTSTDCLDGTNSAALTSDQRRYWLAVATCDLLNLRNPGSPLCPSFSGIRDADATANWLFSNGRHRELEDFSIAFKAIAEATLAGSPDPKWATTVVSGYIDELRRSMTARFQAAGPRRIA